MVGLDSAGRVDPPARAAEAEAMTLLADRNEIGRAFDVLYPPEAVVEMRVPKTRTGTCSG